ncbi:enoyl-CoA hydratase [Evansella caseinilytica]|uniref:Enoyl-CoA hydratase n=1 Tax=Evansella caseinilytica TaxID=1503961 RepID=A0A1H3TTD5_9BACI|nr:enoyl-CoA hydratase [Evansella caseinilytica]SDZ53503.1 enoyl-CoA hydratase [Evansella caseinilytica]
MAEYTLLHWKTEENIAYVSLNNPPANALSSALLRELETAFAELQQDNSVKVILLRGEGRFFAAGADIKEFTTVETAAQFQTMARKGQEVFNKIEAFPKPVIAVIHGAALGGGLELALAAHLRVVAENATLGLPELQLGLIPGFAGTQRLPALVGKAKAAEMILTSEPITGTEAVRSGLANRSFPEEALFAEATALAKKLAVKGAVSVKHALELVTAANQLSPEKGQLAEAEKFGKTAVTADAKEGIVAFLEKRQPVFKDR